MINLMRGDCLELMKSIPDKSVDMVLTDPPYGTTACKWDVVIPFEPMWEQLKRITKDNGAICLFGSEPFSSHLRLSNLKMFKYDWIWQKTYCGNFIQAKNMPMEKHEIICVFSQGVCFHKNLTKKRMEYNPQGVVDFAVEKKLKNSKKMLKTSKHKYANKSLKETYVQKKGNYPSAIISFKSSGNKHHPTQKPVALLEYLIKTYTLENETVLDFTMGSGSTGVACKNINRDFIGIEKYDKYFEIAKDRIQNVVQPTEV